MENSGMSDDLLVSILVRLPAKSLLRFRCVSKSWNLVISSQYFTKMHLNQSLLDPKPLGLIWEEEDMLKEQSPKVCIFAADCSKLENFTPETIQRLHHPFETSDVFEPKLIGSCYGLLCVTWLSIGFKETFLVFNPLTRKGSMFYGETSLLDSVRSAYYGFGYDNARDDYKVVTWGVFPKEHRDNSDCLKFEVYSVKDSSWSTKISGLTDCLIATYSCGVLVNFVLHWTWINAEGRYYIVAFDLRTEEHKLMETPENDLAVPLYDYCPMELGVLNDCLCGIALNIAEVQNELDLWIMKEYGVKSSWIKMTIDMSSQHQIAWGKYNGLGVVTPIVPIVCIENKKQMIFYNYAEGFLLCDMTTNKLSKVIKIPQFHSKSVTSSSLVPKEFRFQDSLVELPGFTSFDSLWDEYIGGW